MLMITFPSTTLLWLLGGLLAALITGSAVRFVSLRNADETLRRKRFASLRTWWILAIVWGGCLLLGHLGICLLLTVVSIVAFYEYAGLLGIRESERPAVFTAYAMAVINYFLILFNQAAAFIIFVPLGALATISLVQILQGQSKDLSLIHI